MHDVSLSFRRLAVSCALWCAACALWCAAAALHAQQPFATVSTDDARVSGLMDVSGHNVRLLTNANLIAFDHTAPVTLLRGGNVNLCANSSFQLLHSSSAEALQFALNFGAMEVSGMAHPQDALLTPDLRLTLLTTGTLDVRMRVARNGDVCVDNRGEHAPVLQVTETFGEGVYHLAPGQHVLFEHGSTRAVVDRETNSCGCPPPLPDAPSTVRGKKMADAHPFPEADSAGLNGASSTLATDPAARASISNTAGGTEGSVDFGAATTIVEKPAAPLPPHDLVHVISSFFARLFHRHRKPKPAPPVAPAVSEPAQPAAAPPQG